MEKNRCDIETMKHQQNVERHQVESTASALQMSAGQMICKME